MHKNGQIAQTMNWVVATVIIVVVLTASFLLVYKGAFDNRLKLPDKHKDFVATKSIVDFVGVNEQIIINAVNSGDYSNFDLKFRPFLDNLQIKFCKDNCLYEKGAWNLRMNDNGHGISLYNQGEDDVYFTTFNFGENKLNFWKSTNPLPI